jgi:hypothetical protein
MSRVKEVVPEETPEMARARRAVLRFKTMLPGLNGYVRAISGNKNLHIEIAAGQPRTNGRKIFFEPPIELGDDLTHVRTLCDKRDPETHKQLCYACDVRETLLIKIYHEIAHNAYGTFERPSSDRELKQKIYQEIAKLEPNRNDLILRDLAKRNEYESYQQLAARVNPFLPTLVNALEDLRVDEAMFKARKGTRSMFYAMTRDIFTNGTTQLDGSVVYWKDMPLNSQALVGIFVVGSKYDFTGWFDPKVDALLRDEVIQQLVSDVDEMKSSVETFERAFPILEQLRKFGFCLTEEEYDEKEQENGDEEDDSSPESGDSGSSGNGEPDNKVQPSHDPSAGSDSGDDGQPGQLDEESSEDGTVLENDTAEPAQDSPGEVQSDEERDQQGDGMAGGSPEGGDESSDHSDGSSGNRAERGDQDESGADEDAREGEEEGSGGSSGESGGADESEAAGESGHQEAEPALEELNDEEGSGDREDSEENGGSDDLLDTGADEGKGGIPLKELYGTADQAEETLEAVTKHGDFTESAAGDQRIKESTIVQAVYFEKESGTVSTVTEHYYGDGCVQDAWTRSRGNSANALRRRGTSMSDYTGVGEQVLGPALLHMRRVFADNARARVEPHLRSGRVNARVLGKRAPLKDPRLFQKKRLPGKRSYAVLLGIDISGSTIGVNIALAKQAAHAQAELCNRLGIEFAVYAHSATPLDNGTHSLDMYAIKDFDSPWNDKAEEALLSIGSWSENLDGHSLEYYRKMIEKHPATDKIILYYSDGKMPAANYSEELEVLQREIEVCRRKNITLLGVGIRTDSPSKHGLDTVQVDGPAEVGKVVRHLESRILHNR